MYKSESYKAISRTTFSILVALSISISGLSLCAEASSRSHHKRTNQNDDVLIAGFPFHKSKKEDTSGDSVKADKRKDKNKDQDSDKQTVKDKDKATAKSPSDQGDAQKDAQKLAKKAEKKKKKKAKEAKKSNADAEVAKAAKAAEEKTVKQGQAEKAAKAAQDHATNAIPPVKKSATESSAAVSKSENGSGYSADSALVSLLNDLSRALKDPAEQAKIGGDDNQKMVVQMAADVLAKALVDAKKEANRIVEKTAISGAPMSAEAWSSGDVKVSDDCRGSLAALWAKRENGLINVTIAGSCRDKLAPSGKRIGEYIVVLLARSTVQKGFDIQSQADVNFWLAKLASVNVDADCCTTAESANTDKSAVTVETGTRELKKNSTVVLQSIITERTRASASRNAISETPSGEGDQSKTRLSAKPVEGEEKNSSEAARKKEKKLAKQAAKENEETEKRAQSLKKAEEERLAVQRKADNEKKAELERKQKAQEELKAEAEKKQKLEDEQRLAEAEKKQKLEEKQRLAEAEKKQKLEEEQQLARLAEAERKDDENRKLQAELKEKAQQIALRNVRLSKDDILAEATRQAELERTEAADMRAPFSSKTENPPSVEIDDQQTALRPTPTASNQMPSSQTPASTIASAATTATTPSIASAPPVTRQSSVGWESPGVPAGVKQPSLSATLVLPERAIAGQYLTASVIDINHNGESGVELGFNGVSLTTDPHGQVIFMVPEDATPGNSLSVAMTGNPQLRASSIEVIQPLTTSSQQETPRVDRTSQMVSSNGTVIIDGHNFDGVADHNKVFIDGTHEGAVTAASPVQLRVVLPNNLLPGVHFATVGTGQSKSNPGRFELVVVEVQPDPKEAGKEQVTKLVVKILGTTNKVQVHLTNQSPDVIKISKGNDLRLTTPGGDNNSTIINVQRLRKGSYRVGAVVE
jgi:outer membrane biosynthesis protein TonB